MTTGRERIEPERWESWCVGFIVIGGMAAIAVLYILVCAGVLR